MTGPLTPAEFRNTRVPLRMLIAELIPLVAIILFITGSLSWLHITAAL